MTKMSNGLAMLVGMLAGAASPAAASSFVITVDTSTLSGTHTALFALTNSDAAGNAVSLSGFTFGGGSAVAGTEDCTLGGAFSGLGCSGDLTSGVTLEDADIAAFFSQQFIAGASLSFVLTATNEYAGGVPDQFAMFLCDAGVTLCYSDDSATGALLLLDLVGGSLTTSSFVRFGAADQSLPAPEISPVPEPATTVLLGSGLVYLLARRHAAGRPAPHD